jgi:hypothetical protein
MRTLQQPARTAPRKVARYQDAFFSPAVIQPKLTVNEPGDVFEREADTVADQVMRSEQDEKDEVVQPKISPLSIQRKCAGCEEEKEKRLQRKAGTNSAPPTTAPSFAAEALHSGGRPLDTGTRAFMESRFGRDFSNVRIHDDALAAKSARSINALALTSGNNIAFNEGQYAPGTPRGKRLLAHELTHVVQQNTTRTSHIQKAECSATRSCSPPDRCTRTDSDKDPNPTRGTSWTLTVHVDIEESDWESALRKSHLGHTHVRFVENNGDEYTYGFYPAGEIPNENRKAVEGCVNHPDTSHDKCVDRAVTFSLSKEQFDTGLSLAQSQCKGRHYYGINSANVSYTCTSFAAEVATATRQALPGSASAPTTIFYQPVPSIDNPNTLIENMAAQNVGVGSDPTRVADFIHSKSSADLSVLPRQEKLRLIMAILNAWWISGRDVGAIEKLCGSVQTSAEMRFLKDALWPILARHMSDIGQRTRVRVALVRL